jgi:hypothetical protein
MVSDSGLNGDCLYAAVIQSNDTMFKWCQPFEGELPERAIQLRERTYRHLQDRCKNRQHLKQGTLLQKLLNDVDEECDCYMSCVSGETSPPAGALEVCALADPMLSDVEMHRPTVMKDTLIKYLDTETGAMRKIKLLLHNNHYCFLQELDRYANLGQTMGIPHLFSYLKEEDMTPVQTLCGGHTQDFRTKMQQSLATWKSQTAMSSFRPISLQNILPQGDEEQLRAQHSDISAVSAGEADESVKEHKTLTAGSSTLTYTFTVDQTFLSAMSFSISSHCHKRGSATMLLTCLTHSIHRYRPIQKTWLLEGREAASLEEASNAIRPCKLPLRCNVDLDAVAASGIPANPAFVARHEQLIGELLYFYVNTMPEIGYGMSCLTRYMTQPTQKLGEYAKQVGQCNEAS